MPVWPNPIVDVLFFVAYVVSLPALTLAFFLLRDLCWPIENDVTPVDVCEIGRPREISRLKRLISLSIAMLSWSLAVGLLIVLFFFNRAFRIPSPDEVAFARVLYVVVTVVVLSGCYLNWRAGLQSIHQKWGRGLAISLASLIGLYAFSLLTLTAIEWYR